MKRMTLQLFPFEKISQTASLVLKAEVQFQKQLRLSYTLAGALNQVILPRAAQVPQKKDNLWKKTCFELFLKPRDSSRYFEWNLSPSGDWNQYEFASYRVQIPQDLSERPAFRLSQSESLITMNATIDLSHLVSLEHHWQIGLSAVLEHSDGVKSYWALKHCADKPDFHMADSFTLLGEIK